MLWKWSYWVMGGRGNMAAAECVLCCARAGESCAGCRRCLQGEFGDVRQVMAQQLPQSQLQQFTLALPLPFPSLPISSAFLHLSILSLSLFFLSNNKGSPEQISALTLGTATFSFSVLLRCLEPVVTRWHILFHFCDCLTSAIWTPVVYHGVCQSFLNNF